MSSKQKRSSLLGTAAVGNRTLPLTYSIVSVNLRISWNISRKTQNSLSMFAVFSYLIALHLSALSLTSTSYQSQHIIIKALLVFLSVFQPDAAPSHVPV